MPVYHASQRSDRRRSSGKRRVGELVTTKRAHLPCPRWSNARRQSSHRSRRTVPSSSTNGRRRGRLRKPENSCTSRCPGSSKLQLPATCPQFSSACKRACLVVFPKQSGECRSKVGTRCSHAIRPGTPPTTTLCLFY